MSSAYPEHIENFSFCSLNVITTAYELLEYGDLEIFYSSHILFIAVVDGYFELLIDFSGGLLDISEVLL